CATSYKGVCIDIFSTCPSGYVQSDSHCGFIELCCYPQHSTGTGTGTGIRTGTGSHTGTGTGSHQTSSGGDSSRSNHNDIALIKLDKPLDLTDSTTKAACLPNKHEDFDGLVCTVTGWGALHTDGPGTRLLNEVDVPIMDSNRCKYYLGNVIYGSNICAGYNQGGRDACQGDSGGPLVCKKDSVYKITGVVSWGYGCAKRHAPGVYTRVSSFIDWINTKLDIHEQNR
ncbi:plasma kallikrein, partial [Mytilus galloprovincialis]